MNQTNTTPVLTIYDESSCPKTILKEVETILRTEWPVDPEDIGKKPSWDILQHIVLSDKNKVLSYGSVAYKSLTHNGQKYKTIGLSGVITRPEERRKGYARKVITTATNTIKKSNADLALFNTAQVGLYEKFGYEHLPEAKILKGDPNSPQPYPEDVFALFLTPKAQNNRKDFEEIPVYFGEIIW